MKSVLRPLSPETSVEKFSKENSEEKKGMSGFRAMFIVSKLMQSRKTKFEERRASLGRAKKTRLFSRHVRYQRGSTPLPLVK